MNRLMALCLFLLLAAGCQSPVALQDVGADELGEPVFVPLVRVRF